MTGSKCGLSRKNKWLIVTCGFITGLVAIAIFAGVVAFYSRNLNHDDDSELWTDKSRNQFEIDCVDVTRGRSFDYYWTCLEHGPVHFWDIMEPPSNETEEKPQQKRKPNRKDRLTPKKVNPAEKPLKPPKDKLQAVVRAWLIAKRQSVKLEQVKEWSAGVKVMDIPGWNATSDPNNASVKIIRNTTAWDLIQGGISAEMKGMRILKNTWVQILSQMTNKTAAEVETALEKSWNGLGQLLKKLKMKEAAEEEMATEENRKKDLKDLKMSRRRREISPGSELNFTFFPWNEVEAWTNEPPTRSPNGSHLDKPPPQLTLGQLVKINNPFAKFNPYLYKHNPVGSQVQPPWSYRGERDVKNWQSIELEKFMVPLNPNLGPEGSEHKLLNGLFTDFHMDHALLDDDGLLESLAISQGKDLGTIGFHQLPFFFSDKMIEFDPRDPETWDPILPRILAKSRKQNYSMNAMLSNRAFANVSDADGYYTYYRHYLPPEIPRSVLEEKSGHLPKDYEVPPKPWRMTMMQEMLETESEELDKVSEMGVYFTAVEDFANLLWPYHYGGSPAPPPPPPNSSSIHNDTAKFIRWEAWKLNQDSFMVKELQAKYSLPVFPIPLGICKDKEPSPLNIIRKDAKGSSIKKYSFNENVDRYYKFTMMFPSDGTNVLMVALEDSSRVLGRGIKMEGGATRGLSLFFEIMFLKVGQEIGAGSEHQLDGRQYDMEVQLLFSYNGKTAAQPWWFTLARQINDLFPYREKLVIMLSVLVRVDDTLTAASKQDDRDFYRFEALAQAAREYRIQEEDHDSDKKQQYRGFQSKDFALRLQDFIPTGPFFTYRGSMTVPPCFSYVLWSVYNETLTITRDQWNALRMIPTKGRDNTDFFGGSLRHVDDIYVEQENKAGISEAMKDALRDARLHRQVLQSVAPRINKDGDEEEDDLYEYFFNYDTAATSAPFHPLVISILAFIILLLT